MKEKGRKAAKFIAETCLKLKAGRHFLVIADDVARARWIAELLVEAGIGLGVDATLVIITPRTVGQPELAPEVGGAMKAADTILHINAGNSQIFHTNATEEAIAAGSKFYEIPGLSEERPTR